MSSVWYCKFEFCWDNRKPEAPPLGGGGSLCRSFGCPCGYPAASLSCVYACAIPFPYPLLREFWLSCFCVLTADLTLCAVSSLATTSSKFHLAGASKLLFRPWVW